LEFPSFVTHLFTCAVPYLPATEQYIPLEAIVKFLPSLGYQLQFGSKEGLIESHTQDKTGIRNFLNALYGGRTAEGENVPEYTTKNVDASHWLLWQKPEEVNGIISEWMQGQGLIAADK
jgi:hypothetical protein